MALTARGRRLARSVLLVALALAVVALVGVVIWSAVRRAGHPVYVTAGCPDIMPGTSNANEDFADMFVAQDRTYISVDGGPRPTREVPSLLRTGPVVTEVTCGLVDPPMSDVGQRIVPLPWPDGTATALHNGTPIYAGVGVPTDCLLAARRDGRLGAYVAIDVTAGGEWLPLC